MNKIRKTATVIIGIDTGTQTGVAVWSKPEKKLTVLKTVMIFEAIEMVLEINRQLDGNLLVRVEDARLRTFIPQERDIKQRVGRAKGAGSVCRDASIWQEILTAKGVPFELVAPKNNKTKMKDGLFKAITGWSERTTSHARDAAGLVIGY